MDQSGIRLVPMTPEMYHQYFREYENDPDLCPDRAKYVHYVYSKERADRYIQRQADLKLYATMLEAASIEIMETEALILKTQPVIQIIQDAYLPDWKERPKRAKWAIAGFAVSLTLTLLFIILRGLLSGEIPNSEPVREKLLQIKTSLYK